MIFHWEDVTALVRSPLASSPIPSEAMEFSVDPAMGPFLVMGASGLLWVDGGRQSVRTLGGPFPGRDILESQILAAIRARGDLSEWGCTFKNDPLGNSQAQARLEKYGYVSKRALVGKGPHIVGDHAIPSPSVGEGEVVWTSVAPEESGWVGLSRGLVFVVIHDPSRAFSFLL